MSLQNNRSGMIVGFCFMLLWCGTAFGMGITALQWGAPLIFPMVAFGMGGFGIVLCVTMCRQQGQAGMPQGIMRRDRRTYTGDYTSPYASAPDRKEYEAPSYCPSCGAAISTDEVDWVAPLKAVCPYCETVIDAVERSW